MVEGHEIVKPGQQVLVNIYLFCFLHLFISSLPKKNHNHVFGTKFGRGGGSLTKTNTPN
jgi:hypothetical protein